MTITVHPVLGPMPVAPCPITPAVCEKIKAEVESKAVTLAHPLVLAKIKQNPVPKGKSYE